MRVQFPFLLMDQSAKFRAIGRSKDAQTSISGATTVVPSLSERWSCSVTLLIKGLRARAQYEAFEACMEGQLGTTLVPVHAQNRAVDQDGHRVTRCTTADFGDAETWEHYGFVAAPVATALVLEAAAVRATQLRVAFVNSTGLRPGQFFSIGERLHQVQYAWDDAGVQVIQFHPPLRAAIEIGAVLVLDNPVCVMQLQSEAEGDYDQLSAGMQSITLNFVEVI